MYIIKNLIHKKYVMKKLSRQLFAIWILYTTSIFPSKTKSILVSKTDPGISIQTKDGIVHLGPYFYEMRSNSTRTSSEVPKLTSTIIDNPTSETQQLCNRTQSVINMPAHVQTTQIPKARTQATKFYNIIMKRAITTSSATQVAGPQDLAYEQLKRNSCLQSYWQINSIVNLPEHLRTKNIEQVREIAIQIKNQVDAAPNIFKGFDNPAIQSLLNKHYGSIKTIQNSEEKRIYKKAFHDRKYSGTNLVELEKERNQKTR